MKIKMIKYPNFVKAPKRAFCDDSGADVFAAETVDIAPMGICKMPLGIGIEIPVGYDAIIHCKSGMSTKGIWLANAPIDPGYRGQIHALLINFSDKPYHIERGDKVGQMVVRPVIYADFVEELGEARGDAGFGSTGVR